MFLFIGPGSSFPYLIAFLLVLVIVIPILACKSGFRNGKREGERLQLKKQFDALKKDK
jgi:hypothetical protein